jgi:HD-GYP domain-containing protein (c-di-GMP phosphodiesterase class II)
MQRKSVPVGELQFGMYIAELDRPWTDTPFMFQGFALRTGQQLEALRKYCRHVFIDVARSEHAPAAGSRVAQQSAPSSAAAFGIHGNAGYAAQADLEHEIALASAVYASTLPALEQLLQPLKNGSASLAGRDVHNIVHELAESVIRNPDALLLLSRNRDTSAPAHARALQVSVAMMAFGRFLQREGDEILLLGLLGLLQDVGLCRLPPAALLARRENPNAEESELMKKHVELSAHILGLASGLPPRLASLALLHHERQDGGGYPRGLRGYQIGLLGSMAAICDAYDSLLAPPPHGAGHSPSAAVKLLLQGRGTAFHGPLLEQFIRWLGAFPVGAAVELDSGETGIVVAENVLQRLKPKVRVLADRAGRPLRPRRTVDLAVDPGLRIRRTLEEGKLAFDARRLF